MSESTIEDQLVRAGCLGADMVAMSHQGTEAEKTKAIIRKALDVWLANGLIEIVDPEKWPTYITLWRGTP